MHYQDLNDDDILCGFRQGDAAVIRKYFYGYCRVGYNIFDQRYQLRDKENLDFMSLSHQYALYLMEHDWKPLEDRGPNISLRTWLINGFRYVVLDALKWHRKEYGSITYQDYMMTFDVTSDLRQQFNSMVEDVCANAALNRQDRLIIILLLQQGYKSKEVAEKIGITPSAVSQRFKKLKDNVLVPYFRQNFDLDLHMPEVIDLQAMAFNERAERGISCHAEVPMAMQAPVAMEDKVFSIENIMEKRTTPEFITELQPNEVFVFGSNLRGMHGGGAAYLAYRKFGAVMGQGVGLQGQSYAIPTMQGGVETIRPYVDEFVAFAKAHTELTFLVTRIGCGIAGFTDDEIAPLFAQAHDVENIILPPGW